MMLVLASIKVTFEAPGSLGIVFGNFGRHNTVLIKDIQPGYPVRSPASSNVSVAFAAEASAATTNFVVTNAGLRFIRSASESLIR